jgi:hypothetical protein
MVICGRVPTAIGFLEKLNNLTPVTRFCWKSILKIRKKQKNYSIFFSEASMKRSARSELFPSCVSFSEMQLYSRAQKSKLEIRLPKENWKVPG